MILKVVIAAVFVPCIACLSADCRLLPHTNLWIAQPASQMILELLINVKSAALHQVIETELVKKIILPTHLQASFAVISLQAGDRELASKLARILSPKAWACLLSQQVHVLYCWQKGRRMGAGTFPSCSCNPPCEATWLSALCRNAAAAWRLQRFH